MLQEGKTPNAINYGDTSGGSMAVSAARFYAQFHGKIPYRLRSPHTHCESGSFHQIPDLIGASEALGPFEHCMCQIGTPIAVPTTTAKRQSINATGPGGGELHNKSEEIAGET